MPSQTIGLRHYSLRKRIHQKNEAYPSPDKFKRFYDKFIYAIVILAPIVNIPQLLKIWIEKDASGVSAISWLFFSVMSVTWFVYGILHKDRHIWMMYSALIVIQAFIAIGAILY